MKYVVLGVFLFSAVKIILVVMMANVFLPKDGKPKMDSKNQENDKKTGYFRCLSAAEKFKRDYFLK